MAERERSAFQLARRVGFEGGNTIEQNKNFVQIRGGQKLVFSFGGHSYPVMYG